MSERVFSKRPFGQSWGLFVKAAPVRLRFLLVLAAAGVVIGGWDTWRTYWDRWIAPAGRDPAAGAVSSDTEYFCPMDPGVLSAWSGQKCPVCNMALVRRAKGDMTPLPSGVVARVQLAPNRVQIGGIRTSRVGFQTLDREQVLVGTIAREADRLIVVAAVDGVDRSVLSIGRRVRVFADPPDGREPITGTLREVDPGGEGANRAVVALSEENTDWPPGRRVRAVVSTPVGELEPFRSLADEPPTLMPNEPRSLFVCHVHPSVIRTAQGVCPDDGDALMARPVASDQRVRWWCPMHPKIVGDSAGLTCPECNGMELVPRVVTYRPKGQVLAVPETAVIDTGTKRIVFVESMPGTFDGLEVVAGPRCGTWIPIVSGLEPGQLVATSGAFLIDAETRLNPSLSAGYFGASRAAVDSSSAPPSPKLDFSGLAPGDRTLAITQATCPVTKKPLGSMGSPVRVQLSDRTVFVCCRGCTNSLREHPEKYLKAAPEGSAHHP